MTDSPRDPFTAYPPVPPVPPASAATSASPAPAGTAVIDMPAAVPYGTPVPEAPKPRTLGFVACIGAVVLFVLSVATSVFAGVFSGGTADPYSTFEQDMAAPVTEVDYQLGVIVVLHLALGSLVGIWTLVQGIFAVAMKRGRAFGVAAIVLAVTTPFLSLLVFMVTTSMVLTSRM